MKFTEKQKAWLIDNDLWFQDADSDQELEALRAKALYDADMASSVENRRELAKAADAGFPSYLLKAIAVTADKDKYADKDGVKKFIDDFFSEKNRGVRDRWEDKINDAYGEGAWDNVKKILRNARIDMMNAEIAKNRADIIEGNAKGQGIGDWLASAAFGLVAPRSKNAVKEGRDPSAREILGDAGENVAYAFIPAGKIGQGMSKGLAAIGKNLPLIKNNARGAGKILGGALSEFIAPTAVEGMDVALGNHDTFEWENPAIGGAINLGVNKGLGRSAGLLLGTLGKKVSTKIPKPIRERLEGVKSQSEKLDDLVEDAESTIRLANETSPRAAMDETLRSGKFMPSSDEQQKAIDIMTLKDAADYTKKDAGKKVKAIKDEIETDKDILSDWEAELQGLKMQEETFGVTPDEKFRIKELEEDLIPDQKNNLVRSSKELDLAERAVKAREIMDNLPDKLSAEQLANKGEYGATNWYAVKPTSFKGAGDVEKVLGLKEGLFAEHPELLGLYGKKPKSKPSDILGEAAMTWAVNKSGEDSDASMLNTLFGVSTKDLRESQAQKREQRKLTKAADVMNLEGVNEDDKAYLEEIKRTAGTDKDVLKGFGVGNTPKFRNWYLLRGADLVKNLAPQLYRPTFEVE